jgi:hypothetical protein
MRTEAALLDPALDLDHSVAGTLMVHGDRIGNPLRRSTKTRGLPCSSGILLTRHGDGKFTSWI